MSDIGKAAKKISKPLGKVVGASIGLLVGGPVGAAAGYKIGDEAGDVLMGGASKAIKASGVKVPKAQAPRMPGAPTVDTAQQGQQIADRIRMRRGVLQNIYGGGSGGSAPAVATKQLLGS